MGSLEVNAQAFRFFAVQDWEGVDVVLKMLGFLFVIKRAGGIEEGVGEVGEVGEGESIRGVDLLRKDTTAAKLPQEMKEIY